MFSYRYYQAWFDVDTSGDEPECSSESEDSREESNETVSKTSDIFAPGDFVQRPRRRRFNAVAKEDLGNTESSEIVSFRDGGSSENSNNTLMVNSKSLILSKFHFN